MSNDPLAALLKAKLREDPGYLDRIIATATAEAAAETQPTSNQNPDRTPHIRSLREEEPRGRSILRGGSAKYTSSPAPTEIIEDTEDESNQKNKGSPYRSRREESLRLKNRRRSASCSLERGVRTRDRSTQLHKARQDSHSRHREQRRGHSPEPKEGRWDNQQSSNERKSRPKSRGRSRLGSRDQSRSERRRRSRSDPRSRHTRSRSYSRPRSRDRKRRRNSRSRSRTPDRLKRRRRSCSRSRSPDDRKYRCKSRSLSPGSGSGSRLSDSRRSRSHSAERPLNRVDSDSLPAPPAGWMDKDYYDRMYSSYAPGNGKGRGGRVFVKANGVDTKTIKYAFLEKLKTREEKFAFIDLHGHPFARKVGIPHFNPYGPVPRDPKVVPRIPRPTGEFRLYVEIGAVGDYEWYLDLLAFMRSLVNELKPDDSVLQAGEKCVTWTNFSSSLREIIFDKGYMAFPVLFHFRDTSNKDCWVMSEIARNFLGGSSAYDGKRKHIKDTTKRMRRNATKIAENRAKEYPVFAREDDPYYIKAPTGEFTFEMPRKPLTKSRVDAPASSTSKRDARRADKVVAEEEVRDKAAASKSEPAKANAGVKTGAALKAARSSKPTAPKVDQKEISKPAKAIRRIDSEDELLNEVRDLLATAPAEASTAPAKSPAPVKPKYKGASATKTNAQAPTIVHGSNNEAVKEPQRKRKAKDTPDESSAKQKQPTGMRTRSSGAPALIEADELEPEPSKTTARTQQQEQRSPSPVETNEEQPKRAKPRPKPRPPPTPATKAAAEVEQPPSVPSDEPAPATKPPNELRQERDTRLETPEPEPKTAEVSRKSGPQKNGSRAVKSTKTTIHPTTRTLRPRTKK